MWRFQGRSALIFLGASLCEYRAEIVVYWGGFAYESARCLAAIDFPLVDEVALLLFEFAPLVWLCVRLAAVAAQGKLRLLRSGIRSAQDSL